jgi:hypothetical protein
MDASRFDLFARALATGTSRRLLFSSAFGTILAIAIRPAVGGTAPSKSRHRPKPLKHPKPLKRPTSCPAGQPPSCAGGCCPAGAVCIDDLGCAPEFHDPCGTGYCPQDDAAQACVADRGCAPLGSKACAGNRYCSPGPEVCVAGACKALPLDQCPVGEGFGGACGATCSCFNVILQGTLVGALCLEVPNPIGSLCADLPFCADHHDCAEGDLCVSQTDCSADAVCLPLCPSYATR